MTAIIYSKKEKEVIAIVYDKHIIPPDWPWTSDYDKQSVGYGDTIDAAIADARDSVVHKEACAKEMKP